MTSPGVAGVGIAAERRGDLVAYGFAAPNPDGRAWTLELADGSGDYGGVLSRMLGLLEAGGMTEAVLWVHARHLEPPPDLVTPDRNLHLMATDLPVKGRPRPAEGVRIRGFEVAADREALLELNNRVFAGHPEQGGWTAQDLDDRLRLPWFDPRGVRTAWIDGRLAAFNWTKVHPDPAPGGAVVGEIYVIGVDSSYRGKGLGLTIALDGLRYLSGVRGATRAILYVDSSNRQAGDLYRRLGFATEHVDRAYRWVSGT